VPDYTRTPASVAAVHKALWYEVVNLQGLWQTYERLFMKSPESVQLLNWAAPSFFGWLQNWLVDHLMLSILRLLDPPKSVGKDNAVLERLAIECDTAGRRDVAKEVRLHLDEARRITSPMREQRNRRIAHLDFDTHVEAAPLPKVLVQEIIDSFKLIKKAMNAVELAFEERTTAYSAYSQIGDAASLLNAIERAKDAHDREALE
jgi:hypothetical protein